MAVTSRPTFLLLLQLALPYVSPRCAGDMRMITLKAATDAGTTAEVRIPVHGGAGVNLGAIGWALGLEPPSVRLNGHFVSRGPDFVSSLSWDSLLSFFAARGLPCGASPLDFILVQGKPIDQAVVNAGWHSSPEVDYVGHLGFKRNITENNERPRKKNRLFERCSVEKNVGAERAADDDFRSIKRQLELADNHPSKKGKVNFRPQNMKNAGNLLTEQEKSSDYFRMKRHLMLDDDDHAFKKVKIDDHNSGFCQEESKIPAVFTRTG